MPQSGGPVGESGSLRSVGWLRPFFSYYGGKWRIAHRYPRPEHARIVEPFAGAAGYATVHAHREVALYDANPVVVGLWQYLINVSPEEVRRLAVGIEHVDELGPVPQEARWIVGWWLNKGTAAPCLQASTRFLSGQRPRSHWGPEIRERIAWQVDHIRHWTVTLADYLDVPVDGAATWFVDPPYDGRDGSYYSAGVDDYSALADWCRSLPGQVIVCEQEGADWLPFETFYRSKSMEGVGRAGICDEVIWTNTERERQLALFGPKCEGTGHASYCLASADWCEANPLPGHEDVERHTAEWFTVPCPDCGDGVATDA